jgi:hypothetical protein
VIIALWDNDQLAGQQRTQYLARSAAILFSTVVPAPDSRHNLIDKDIRLVLTGDGPVYLSCEQLDESAAFRRVGNVYYSRDFAELLKAEALVHKSKVRSFLPRLAMMAQARGCESASLFPTKQETWWGILEDVFCSPVAQRLRQSYLTSMVANEELESLSIDSTMRVTMSIMGQAHWRSAKSDRKDAAIAEKDSFRRVLTVRGRTGGVIAMCALHQDNVASVCACLASAIPLDARQGVRFIAVDDPSVVMWQGLKDMFPRLEVLSLDPVHLAIVYEYSTWKKRSPGSRFLRDIMNKFNTVDSNVDASAWGGIYIGGEPLQLSREEELYRHQVLDQSMNKRRAQQVQERLAPNSPFYSRVAFIESIAALCALHSDEVLRKVASANKPVFRVLWSLERSSSRNETRLRCLAHAYTSR